MSSPTGPNDRATDNISTTPSILQDVESQQQSTDASSIRKPRRPRPEGFPESQASKMWKALGNPPGGPINEMPGGTYNSAGGKPKEPTWRDALSFDNFNPLGNAPNRPAWYRTGVVRDALLVGILAGGVPLALGFVFRGVQGLKRSANYAVGTFTVTAVGVHQWGVRRQKEEAKGIAAAVTGMKLLHEKRDREARELKIKQEEARKLEEEERLRKKTWYKWW